MEQPFFEESLIQWYRENKRDLPWRETTDPYKIWLSEVMLQQTRVKQGLPYYLRFVEHYPTVNDMAKAEEQEILRLWQGLGYYSRARNMHQTAKLVTNAMQGVFPKNYKDLLKLKGVGKYTAAAIASFAYNEPVAVVDGNVYRVLARILGIDSDIASTEGQKIFAQEAAKLVSEKNAGEYNQAIMEFGATQCTPQKPNCMFCPFAGLCVANQTGAQATLPVKLKKVKVRDRFFHYLVLEHEGEFILKERKEKGIWQGLYDFINIENERKLTEEELLEKVSEFLAFSQITLKEVSEEYKHVLTHQRLFVRFYHIILQKKNNRIGETAAQFFTTSQVERLPKPTLIQKYLEKKFN